MSESETVVSVVTNHKFGNPEYLQTYVVEMFSGK
jgi:hypothetical protein